MRSTLSFSHGDIQVRWSRSTYWGFLCSWNGWNTGQLRSRSVDGLWSSCTCMTKQRFISKVSPLAIYPSYHTNAVYLHLLSAWSWPPLWVLVSTAQRLHEIVLFWFLPKDSIDWVEWREAINSKVHKLSIQVTICLISHDCNFVYWLVPAIRTKHF